MEGKCTMRDREGSCPDGFCCAYDEFFRSIRYCKKYGVLGKSCSTVPSDQDCSCGKGLMCQPFTQSSMFVSIYGRCVKDPNAKTTHAVNTTVMMTTTTPNMTTADNSTTMEQTTDRMTTVSVTTVSTGNNTSVTTKVVGVNSTKLPHDNGQNHTRTPNRGHVNVKPDSVVG